MHCAANRKESRGAHMHEDYPRARRQELDEAHASPGSTAGAARAAAVKIDYRPVHEYTLTDEIEYIKPKARVY